MNAVGIDISGGKSTVAVLRPFGEVVMRVNKKIRLPMLFVVPGADVLVRKRRDIFLWAFMCIQQPPANHTKPL